MIAISRNLPLAPLTTLKVGGSAEYFVAVKTKAELLAAIDYAKENQLKVTILGGGSNVLIKDDGLKGLVIQNLITGINEAVHDNDVLVTVGAGEEFDVLVANCVKKGYWGLENLSHIPGLVGATPIQNVGAYGVEVSDLITTVNAYNLATGQKQKFSHKECQFSYRHSFFKTAVGKQLVITKVTYRLSLDGRPKLDYPDLGQYFKDNPKPNLKQIRQAIIAIRSQKFPDWKRVGTAGSFFKNSIITQDHYRNLKSDYPDLPGWSVGQNMTKVPLGYIIDKICNYRGVRVGSVGTYERQALVMVNYGGATALEIEKFAHKIARLVKTKTDIAIEWEVTALP